MLDQAHHLEISNRLPEAAALYARLLRDRPKNATVLRAVIAFHNRFTRQFRAALPHVDTLLALRPKDARSHQLAAETLLNCARLSAGLAHAERALALAPDDPDSQFVAAVAGMSLGRYPAAAALLDRALSARPGHPALLLQKGRLLRDTGALADAAALARDALATAPGDMNFLELYASCVTFTAGDPVLAHLRAATATDAGGPLGPDLLMLRAKAETDLGHHAAALALAGEAKALTPPRHDEAGYAAFVRQIAAQVSRASFFGRAGSASDQPLLIVGLPRSGSTLLEQMLARHSAIATAGESPSLGIIAQDIGLRAHDGAAMARAIATLPAGTATALAQRYTAETADGRTALRVVDKALHNFELLGLFALMFPRARIIRMARDPVDTCVSCYLARLSAWHGYTRDLGTLGRYYRQAGALMDHWAQVLPNPVLTVVYEDLVRDPAAQMRRVLEFAGLSWEEGVLVPDAAAPSRTLSSAQVRGAISTAAIGRAAHYGAALDPLRAALATP